MANLQTHTGGCHCGAVRYEVALELERVMACNCSICSKKGTLLSFVPVEQFELLSGEDALADYQFNKKIIHHLFCKTCGVESFAKGVGPDGKPMRAINVRCLDDVDVSKLDVSHFDGKRL
jgi:hypothetical protein